MAMSVLAPNQISKKGQLDNNVWLAGCVVRTRDRAPTGGGGVTRETVSYTHLTLPTKQDV